MIIDPSTATLAWLQTSVALLGKVCLSDELPTGITNQDSPDLVVVQLESGDGDTLILPASFSVRYYGGSFKSAWALYQAVYALTIDTVGMPTGMWFNGRWSLRDATLTVPYQFYEQESKWRGYAGKLRTRWHLMEI